MVKIEYSVLSHSPNLINNEHINLGIMFHDINEDKYIFKYISDFEEVSKLNNELDIPFLKLQLKEIKREIEKNLVGKKVKQRMESFTKYYVNSLKFDEVINVECNDFYDFIEKITPLYLNCN